MIAGELGAGFPRKPLRAPRKFRGGNALAFEWTLRVCSTSSLQLFKRNLFRSLDRPGVADGAAEDVDKKFEEAAV